MPIQVHGDTSILQEEIHSLYSSLSFSTPFYLSNDISFKKKHESFRVIIVNLYFSFRNLSLELEIKSDALPKLRGIPSDHPLSLKVDPNGYFILDTHTLKELSKLHARASFVEYLHAVIELLRAGKLDERRRRQ